MGDGIGADHRARAARACRHSPDNHERLGGCPLLPAGDRRFGGVPAIAADSGESHRALPTRNPRVRGQRAGVDRVRRAGPAATPTLGRPPYGGVTRKVLDTAHLAGLREVVMWSAEMARGRLPNYDHRPLRAGEIVILHWVPRLYHNLSRLLHIAAARGLHPEPLRLRSEPAPQAPPGVTAEDATAAPDPAAR